MRMRKSCTSSHIHRALSARSMGASITPNHNYMTSIVVAFTPLVAAAGPAFLVWLFGGGFGLALLVFIVLKVIGR
jgi:hypothetical protein